MPEQTTSEILQKFPPKSTPAEGGDPFERTQGDDPFSREVRLKFFHPLSRYTFFAVEAEQTSDNDVLMFGYCVSPLGPDCDEWGYMSYNEIKSVAVRGLPVEIDRHFKGTVRDGLRALGLTA